MTRAVDNSTARKLSEVVGFFSERLHDGKSDFDAGGVSVANPRILAAWY